MVALARAFVGQVLGQLFRTDSAAVAFDLWCACKTGSLRVRRASGKSETDQRPAVLLTATGRNGTSRYLPLGHRLHQSW